MAGLTLVVIDLLLRWYVWILNEQVADHSRAGWDAVVADRLPRLSRRLRCRLLKSVLPLLIGSYLTLGVLCFGDCQWSRAIYIFQCYTLQLNVQKYGCEIRMLLDPDPSYSGIWCDWRPDGSIGCVTQIKCGISHGLLTYYRSGGQCETLIYWNNQYICDWPDNDWYLNGNYPRDDQQLQEYIRAAANETATPAAE